MFFMTSCASHKLKNTVWYNVTMMGENGVTGNVGTSLVFETDSTLVAYKGVQLDTTVVLKPFVYAYGNYQCKKMKGRKTQVSIAATTKDGTPFEYSGTFNKKKGMMILDIPKSTMKETYLRNPKAKLEKK